MEYSTPLYSIRFLRRNNVCGGAQGPQISRLSVGTIFLLGNLGSAIYHTCGGLTSACGTLQSGDPAAKARYRRSPLTALLIQSPHWRRRNHGTSSRLRSGKQEEVKRRINFLIFIQGFEDSCSGPEINQPPRATRRHLFVHPPFFHVPVLV